MVEQIVLVVLLESNRALLAHNIKSYLYEHVMVALDRIKKEELKSNNTEKVFRCCVPATWPSQGNHSLHGDGTSNLIPTL